MNQIEKIIAVNVPVSVVYNQWTQFEDFLEFMRDLDEVTLVSDSQLDWRAGGIEGDITIVEQAPDYRIAWRGTSGLAITGSVTFHPRSDNVTEVRVKLSYDPVKLADAVRTWATTLSERVETDLQDFKQFIESPGHETGAWRGSIRSEHGEKPGARYPS